MEKITPSHINLCGWMLTELNLSGDLLLAYAWFYNCYRFHQNKYLLFSETVDFMSEWFKYDRVKTRELITELEQRKLIELELVKSDDKHYAKIKINEPEYKR